MQDCPGAGLILTGGHATTAPSTIRSGVVSVALLPPGSYEAKSVRVGGEQRLYVRYVGEPSPEVQR